jgi:hypothetical protein
VEGRKFTIAVLLKGYCCPPKSCDILQEDLLFSMCTIFGFYLMALIILAVVYSLASYLLMSGQRANFLNTSILLFAPLHFIDVVKIVSR